MVISYKLNKGIFIRNNLPRYIYYKVFKPRLHLSKENLESYLVFDNWKHLFSKYITQDFSPEINEQFNGWSAGREVEYLYYYNHSVIIEPYHGWVLNEHHEALRRSFPYSVDNVTQLPHYIYYKKKKKVRFESGYSLRYNWFNYWHFYNDIIAQLYLLDQNDFDKNIHLIVPEKALKLEYVKSFFETEFAKKWNWFFQEPNTYVQLDNVYLGKYFSNIKPQFIFAKDIFGIKAISNDNRRIFLNRKKARGRNIINWKEVESIIKQFGFEIIDTDGMTVRDQGELFASAAVVSGIHGAGLTNIIYRHPSSCLVLELFPKGHYPTHYYWLTKELGFDYDALSGENNLDQSFILSPEKLEKLFREHGL